MNNIDQLAQEMTEYCHSSIQAHQVDSSFSDHIRTLFEKAQCKFYALPWDEIKRIYPVTMTAFIVLGIIAGADDVPDGWARNWMRY